MKKKNLKALSLNKSKISNLVKGGTNVDTQTTIVSLILGCPPNGTTSKNNCGGSITDATLIPTCADGCTRATVELSYCNNGVPDSCQSVQACA
ncbi:MAG: hypothetical protein AAF617_03640 [Bacteroidota bacterium]